MVANREGGPKMNKRPQGNNKAKSAPNRQYNMSTKENLKKEAVKELIEKKRKVKKNVTKGGQRAKDNQTKDQQMANKTRAAAAYQ